VNTNELLFVSSWSACNKYVNTNELLFVSSWSACNKYVNTNELLFESSWSACNKYVNTNECLQEPIRLGYLYASEVLLQLVQGGRDETGKSVFSGLHGEALAQ
jgi:hypothetical protein